MKSKAKEIFEELKSSILNGERDASKPLPSTYALMRKFGVARGTIDRAMSELIHAGIIERRKGSGTFPITQKPVAFGVILPDAKHPFYSSVCAGLANCAKNANGGGGIRCYGRPLRLEPNRTSRRLRRCAWMRR